jgi:hypothetical protein
MARLGYYRLHVNGRRADDHELGALTVYERTLLYDAVDVAPLLRPGAANALGVTLGRGWYSCSGCLALRLGSACGRAGTVNATNPDGDNTCGQYAGWPLGPTGIATCASPCPRSFILRLVASFADGSSFELVSDTDGKWQQSDGPVVSESIYLGVVHDGRREQPGWTLPGFVPADAARWIPAVAPAVAPVGAPETLTAQTMPQIKKIRSMSSQAITIPRPGVFLVDFGENMAGWATLNISGAAQRGANITMVYGEILTNASSCWSCQMPFKSNVSRAQSCPCRSEVAMRYPTSPMVDVYILRGGTDERFEPVGTYHGFRYVEVHGYPSSVLAEHNIMAHLVATDLAPVGAFSSSNELVNTLQAACVRTVAANQMGMPTDCPQRERRGWTGDAQISSDTVAWNFDAQAYWSQYLGTIADNQAKYASSNPHGGGKGVLGGISGVIPDYGYDGGGNSDPIWQAVLPRLWHHMLTFYDDRATLGRHYEGVKAYLDYLLQGVDRRGLLVTPGADYGDWVAPIDTVSGRATANGAPSSHVGLLISTAQLIEDLRLFVDGAAALGYADVAANYSFHHTAILSSFSANFFNESTGLFSDQCSNYTEYTTDPTYQYSHRFLGDCLNGTLLRSFAVKSDGQCCGACSSAGSICSGWTILRNDNGGDSIVCQLLQAPLLTSNNSTGCRSGVGNNKTEANGLQTLNALALEIGSATSSKAFRAIGEKIATDVSVTNGNHSTTGLVGTRYILPALSAAGQGEVAMQLVLQTEAPSWGYMVAGSPQTPGTIWESYTDLEHMASSFNHPMFTSFEPWFYTTLGGLRPTGPGFSGSRVQPQLLGNLSSVNASIDTVAGLLGCAWVKADASLRVEVTIPPNTVSRVTLPCAAGTDTVTEGSAVVWRRGKFVAGSSAGVTAGAEDSGLGLQPGVSFDVGSGRYVFVVAQP